MALPTRQQLDHLAEEAGKCADLGVTQFARAIKSIGGQAATRDVQRAAVLGAAVPCAAFCIAHRLAPDGAGIELVEALVDRFSAEDPEKKRVLLNLARQSLGSLVASLVQPDTAASAYYVSLCQIVMAEALGGDSYVSVLRSDPEAMAQFSAARDAFGESLMQEAKFALLRFA